MGRQIPPRPASPEKPNPTTARERKAARRDACGREPGDRRIGQRQEIEAFFSGSMRALAENGLVR